MRQRRAVPVADGAVLPAELAGGPMVDVWFPQWRSAADLQEHRRRAARQVWSQAGRAWSLAHGLGEAGWRELLPASVREATEIRRVL